MRGGMKRLLPLMLLLPLLACSPNVETRGHMLDADWKEHLKAGSTSKEEVLQQFGSPSTTSTFGEETWYYITLQRESHAFFKPKIAEENVIRIVFDGSGVVQNVDTFDQSDMQKFAIAKRETPTEGHQMTIVEQTLGNLGRFNNSSTGRTNPGTVRRGGP